MANQGLLGSTIARKFAMALSALFLIVFLLQHMSINMLSVFSADTFNEVSHFMGTFWLVQYVMQPILIFGVLLHFILGFILEYKNWSSRKVKYANYKGSANASWMSRNMIYTGAVILLFLGLHFYDFWIPEIAHKFVEGKDSFIENGVADSGYRFYHELRHKFDGDIVRMILYVVSFIFLGLHLNHGFESAFQSMGARSKKYTPIIKKLGTAYSILIPLGFIVIAVYHYVTQL